MPKPSPPDKYWPPVAKRIQGLENIREIYRLITEAEKRNASDIPIYRRVRRWVHKKRALWFSM
ncbi:MAG: hypothetical protein PHP75_01860 [Methylacidiphilaceae bacterium]|nr:hypothetical protein [Candidatus Methylacidiphilaceae bacterium]